MMSSLLFEDVTIEKGSTIKDNFSLKSSSSLHVICDNCTLTMTRNTFVSLLVSAQQSDLPSYRYIISDDNAGSMCEILCVEECILSSTSKICGLIRYQLLRGSVIMYILKDKCGSFLTQYQFTDIEMETTKLNFDSSRKKISFIRIGKKLPTSDRNVSLQFSNKVKAPLVRTFEFSRILLQCISDDISDSNDWSKKIHYILKEISSLKIKERLSIFST